MSNPLFNVLGGGNTNNMIGMLNQLRANPVQFLLQKRLNIPDNLSNDPQGIVQHLLNTGQMSQNTYNKLQSQINQMIGR